MLQQIDTGCYNMVQVFTRNRSTRDGLLSEEATMVALGEVTLLWI